LSAIPIWCPECQQSDVRNSDLLHFGEDAFAYHTHWGFLQTERLAITEMASFSETVEGIPLLQSTANDFLLARHARDLFAFILAYSVFNNDNRSHYVAQIIDSIPALVDEVYAQLLKQLQGCPYPEAVKKTWDLLFIVASFYPPTDQIRAVVRQALAAAVLDDQADENPIMQLTYLRFLSRLEMKLYHCTCELVQAQLSQIENSNCLFQVSINELLWRQRSFQAQCPVPVFFYRLCEKIRPLAMEDPAPFSRGVPPGIDAALGQIDQGLIGLDRIQALADLVGLLFRFLQLIPGGLVTGHDVSKREGRFNQGVVDGIPLEKRNVLGYLVGFVREFVSAGHPERSFARLAEIFASVVLKVEVGPPAGIQHALNQVNRFFEELLREWIVGFVYPIRATVL
jgi:hypothetical protein